MDFIPIEFNIPILTPQTQDTSVDGTKNPTVEEIQPISLTFDEPITVIPADKEIKTLASDPFKVTLVSRDDDRKAADKHISSHVPSNEETVESSAVDRSYSMPEFDDDFFLGNDDDASNLTPSNSRMSEKRNPLMFNVTTVQKETPPATFSEKEPHKVMKNGS